MLPVLAAITAWSGLPSRAARVSSRWRMRPVAMRPGTTTLTVMPSAATSRASVFDQPTSVERSAFDRPRSGIGITTPDDALVMTRPQRRRRMAGSTRSVIRVTDSTMARKCFSQTSDAVPVIGPGGGPPVMFTRMSTSPTPERTSSTIASSAPRSEKSAANAFAVPPAFVMAAVAASRAVLSTSDRHILAPSSASVPAMRSPSPPPAARTSATLFFSPKSIASSRSNSQRSGDLAQRCKRTQRSDPAGFRVVARYVADRHLEVCRVGLDKNLMRVPVELWVRPDLQNRAVRSDPGKRQCDRDVQIGWKALRCLAGRALEHLRRPRDADEIDAVLHQIRRTQKTFHRLGRLHPHRVDDAFG